jgi:hypothetical protein
METLIGFAAGFVVGSQYGRDGLAKIRESWSAINSSPEFHRLLRTGADVAGSLVRDVTKNLTQGRLQWPLDRG